MMEFSKVATLSYIDVEGKPVVMVVNQAESNMKISWGDDSWSCGVWLNLDADPGVAIGLSILKWTHIFNNRPAVLEALKAYAKALSDRASAPERKMNAYGTFALPRASESASQISVSWGLNELAHVTVTIRQSKRPEVWMGEAEYYCREVTEEMLRFAVADAFLNHGHTEVVPSDLKAARPAIEATLVLVAQAEVSGKEQTREAAEAKIPGSVAGKL